VISAENAWSVSFLLRDVVQRGTGSEYEGLPFPVAGKTGTTTAYDAWFAGFTPREAAVVWIGTDRNTRPLGRRETGGRLAMPIWVEGLLPASVEFPLLARQPSALTMVPMDPESGLIAPADRWAVTLPFYERFAPVQTAPTREEQTLQRIDQLQREF
jgi:penicillin-binding protein 1A